jgi:hypothetical protein
VPVDGVLGQAEAAGDLLGAEMLVHETQAIALALGQPVDTAHCLVQAIAPTVMG